MHDVQLLVLCVLGIYASFIYWGILQEEISEKAFNSPFLINLVQNVLAAAVGFVYLKIERKSLAVFRNTQLLKYLLVVALTQSLSSSIGLMSVPYVGYLLYTLTKSCKLIPVMLVYKLLYGKKFPLYKYVVVGVVTTGVLLFTVFKTSKNHDIEVSGHFALGMLYLCTALLLDGLTNSTQDIIFTKFDHLSGAHLMFILNFMSVWLNLFYFLSSGQLGPALQHIRQDPSVLTSILSYGLCGSVGQIFIFFTLHKFGAIVLITVTVTRKMFSMVISVLLFGHVLGMWQWVGLLLVFAGIAYEAYVKSNQSKQSAAQKKKN